MHKDPNIKVTICIPTYNRSDLLKELVEDLTHQNILCTYEILIINDSDFLEQINTCKKLANKYPQVRYIQNTSNLGLFQSLEHNFGQIRGDYVIFPGDDDKLLPGLIDRESEILDKHTDVVMVAPCFNLKYIKENLTSVKKVQWKSKNGYRVFSGPEIAIDYLSDQKEVNKKYSIVWPSIMFRQDILDKTGHFKYSTKIAGDTMVIGKVLAHGNYAQISDVLFDFINYGGALRELNSSNGTAFHERVEMLNNLEKYLASCKDCSPKIKEYDLNKFKQSLAKRAFSLNGPAVWIASRHNGSYFDRLNSLITIFILSVKIYPQILLSISTYIVFFSCLFLPAPAFFYAAKIYNVYKR